MENMYFSPTTVGFYVSEQERPDDAVEVSPEVGCSNGDISNRTA